MESTSGWLNGNRSIIDCVDNTNSFILELMVAPAGEYKMEIQAQISYRICNMCYNKCSPIANVAVLLFGMLSDL